MKSSEGDTIMDKQTKIKKILELVRTIEKTSLTLGGFSELDQTEIEYLHNELIKHLTHEGLDKYTRMLEGIIKNEITCEID